MPPHAHVDRSLWLLIKTATVYVVLTHTFACGWWLLVTTSAIYDADGVLDGHAAGAWVIEDPVLKEYYPDADALYGAGAESRWREHAPDEYLRCLYWSTVTFVTVGFGDIVAKSVSEEVNDAVADPFPPRPSTRSPVEEGPHAPDARSRVAAVRGARDDGRHGDVVHDRVGPLGYRR